MKITVTRKSLHEGLQIVGRAVALTTSLPILRNVLIETGQGSVKLSATDLELGVEIILPAMIGEAGRLTVPAKTFNEIVSALPEADVDLSVDEQGTLIVRCLRSNYRVHSLTAEEFPAMTEVSDKLVFSVPQALMKEWIKQTAFAASDDDTRPILTGVLLSLKDSVLTLAATDTHRLAVRTAKDAVEAEDFAAIIPVRALNELARVLGDEPEAVVQIRIETNQIMFRTERVTLTSRLIEGNYPLYQRLIPSSHTRRLTIQRDDLQIALRRAKIMARDAAAKDRVVLATEGESLVITAVGEEGFAREEIEVVREGEEISVAFNVSYLIDALGVIETDGVYLEMTEPLAPAVIRPVEDDVEYIVTIMPMQVQ